jgi:hypothetical protein
MQELKGKKKASPNPLHKRGLKGVLEMLKFINF